MIHILPKQLIHKIAAGEVVERPASIVKELMENALDAHATNIKLTVHKGGLEEVSVYDNGDGIASEDVKHLFHSHATSKVRVIEDLHHMMTFGFRGEALASIASIAQVNMRTKTADALEGIEIVVHNGVISIQPTAMNKGTSVIVKDLFYNVPARRKFMKSERTELSYCVKIFQEIALVHPDITFQLSHNGTVLLTYEKTSMQERVRAVIKTDLTDYAVVYDASDIRIEGAFTKPGNNEKVSEQYIFVNKRPVSSAIIYKAVREAYTSFLKKDSKPSFIISLSISPEIVDVNVHPRKVEVRFIDQNRVYYIVTTAVGKLFERLAQEILPLHNETNAYIPSLQFPKKLFVEKIVAPTSKKALPKDISASMDFTKHLLSRSELPVQQAELDVPQDIRPPFADTQFLQIDAKFIVFGYQEKIYIVDQHAAAERINYERYTQEWKDRSFSYTVPLFPLTIELTPQDYPIVLDKLDIFSEYGVLLEDMGSNMVSITQFSTHFPFEQVEPIFWDIFTHIRDGEKNRLHNDEKIIASLACRSAIMFGKKLTELEMRALITDLFTCKTPFTCAHGRPVAYTLTHQELLKKLARC